MRFLQRGVGRERRWRRRRPRMALRSRNRDESTGEEEIKPGRSDDKIRARTLLYTSFIIRN